MADIRFREFGNGATWVDFPMMQESEPLQDELTQPTQAQIEAAAKAVYGTGDWWEKLDEQTRQNWRRIAKVILAAAAEAGEKPEFGFGPPETAAPEAGEPYAGMQTKDGLVLKYTDKDLEEAFNDGYEDMREEIPRIKNETIERCAQVAERELQNHPIDGATVERIMKIIAAIRALKEKP